MSHWTQEPPFEFLPAEPGIQQGASRRIWSRSRTPCGSARSPTSRCPLVLATAANDAAANLRVEGPQACAGPRPRSERLPGCDQPAPATVGRRARAQPPPAGTPRRPSRPQRPRGPAPGQQPRCWPPPPCQRVPAGGTPGAARSSSPAIPHAICPSCLLDHCSDVLTASGRSTDARLALPSGKFLARVV